MSPVFPKRPESHQIAAESRRFFEAALPRGWTCEEPKDDYGIDLRVGIVQDGEVTGRSFVVQLKASQEEAAGESVTTTLRVATYNYLRAELSVAMFVKYVASEGEAYYVLLRHLPRPNQAQESFTIHLPRANRLSTMDWKAFDAYIADIHTRKLEAGEDPPEQAH